ncbi:MAG: S8 family serine peptidase, partial [Methylocella sp.]
MITIPNPQTGRLTRVLAGEVLVKFPAGQTTLTPLLQKYRLKLLGRIPELSLYRIGLPSDMTVPTVLTTLALEPGVGYVEPQYLMYPAEYFPNDPQLGFQWGLAKIHAFGAWDLITGTHGNPSVAIAIVDTGVD